VKEGLCQLVKDREGLWCSRPFGNCSKDFGYKKHTKAGSGSALVPIAPLLLGPVPARLTKRVAAAAGILLHVVLVYRTTL